MNCKQANENISIKEVMESFSLFPSKEHPKTAYYNAINRQERTPSLLVNYVKNIAFDFGTGKQYDVVSIVQELKQCTVSDALEYLSRFDFPYNKPSVTEAITAENTNQILEVKELIHPALLDYLKSRKLESQKSELSEVHYRINDKRYFGLGFKNDSGGYEIRSSFSKICLGKKDITTIKNNSENLKVFEGFTDYFSFKILEPEKTPSDHLILNSVAMVHKTSGLFGNYKSVEMYLDNDRAGEQCRDSILKIFPEADDRSNEYFPHQDLNDFLISQEEKTLENKLEKNQTAIHEPEGNRNIYRRKR
ncbi:DNA primase [Chryseobacterium carnipullorum]|uniref:DNA primase n=1 Tax=Chryseobacterium carnipullorum TaxID=1124835 RepID=A0A376ES96_CHRCU|nr:toprim domain-containing protein [Chryseobacterium carnipullorum]AZA48018.1 DNA primase [Chryseobacterium carnipullorum]AZA67334.1 DNA primase [Chryseobacterium carnipullorum]STD13434.1 DNA primase (bacterial type) [Chryseobacterium carnipullorum]